jgi:hypothetical protein
MSESSAYSTPDGPKRYRKKPVVIEAMRFQPSSHDRAFEIEVWGGKANIDVADHGLYVKTLEGRMHVSGGDYVIRGVAGEFYPCKPDIFEATYEVADDDR